MKFTDIKIDTKSIKLEQFLKWAEVTASGGQAKVLIADGNIRVNGKVEFQRGKQLKEGDIVEVDQAGIFKVVT